MGVTEEHQDTIAFVLIKAELRKVAEVAAEVSARDGVHWTVVVTGPYDIIAGVRVRDNEALGNLVMEEIQTIPGVRNPLTVVVTKYYRGGGPEAPHGGFP